jgi:DNA-binding NtrC family response regulator
VLVIDDEVGIRRLACMLLEEAGFDVDLAADGDEALERIHESSETPDLILLDVTMPRRSGVEVLEEIRRVNTDLPVVLMSGFTESEVASVLESDPRTSFLQKPFTGESLQQVVRAALGAGLDAGS